MVFTTEFGFVIVNTTNKACVNPLIRNKQHLVDTFISRDAALTALWNKASNASDNYLIEGASIIDGSTNRGTEVYAKGETRFVHDGNCYEVKSIQDLIEQHGDSVLVKLASLEPNTFTLDQYNQFEVRDREAGNPIDTFYSLREAKLAVLEFEETDKSCGDYEPNFYEIYDLKNQTIVE